MNKSILIDLLSKFTPKEIREFGEYVHSPFFNKNESVIKLFEYIRKHYPDFDNVKLKKESVFEKIFPNIAYNDGFMRTIIFNLTELAETYLAFIRYKECHFTERKYLLHELNEKELDRQIERIMKKTLKEFESIKIQDADYYSDRFMIEYEYFYYLNRANLDKIERFINRTDVEDMFNHLTYFYLFYAIKHYVYFLNTQSMYSINFKTGFIEDIFRNLEPDYFQDIPTLSLYYDVLMLFLKEDDTSYFYKVKKKVNEYGKRLNRYEITGSYINLENYCKRMIRKGNNVFLKELLEIYKIKIEKKLYALQKEMSGKFYRGVVDTALKLKEFDWAKEFIEKYKDELPADSREDFYYYCLSLYEFAVKNFEKSLELLSKVKYTEVYQKTELRCLIAELYYELDMDDMLLSHIDSFRHFLVNDKLIPAERKEHYCNFIKYIKNLNKLKGNENEAELHCLNQKISENSAVYNKDWLIEKAAELQKK
jgi:hypothetical protein